jgi:hypothetical protein
MQRPIIGVDAPLPKETIAFQVGHWQRGSPAIAGDGTLYCTPSGYGRDQLLKCFSLSGSEGWMWTFPNAELSRPAIGLDETVYLIAREGSAEDYSSSLYAINPDGTAQWKYECTGYASVSPFPIVDAEGAAYAVFGGHLHKIDRNGKMHWALPMDRSAEVTLAIGRNQIIVLNGSGWQSHIQSVSLSGERLWEYKAPFDPEEITRQERQRIAKEDGTGKASWTAIHIMFALPNF